MESPNQVKDFIERLYGVAQRGDYYALLGVAQNATTPEVKRAYFGLVKKVHPDRLGKLGLDDMRPQATRLFNVLTQAFDTLSDPHRRAEYRAGKISGATPTRPTQREGAVNTEESAKIAYHKGRVMATRRSFAEAEALFREAVEAKPDVARYWQSLGSAIFFNEDSRSEKSRLAETRKCYEKSLDIDEEDAQTHYSVALYWKAMGNRTRAKKALQKAVALKSDFIEAKRELRLMQMRLKRAKADTKTGPLSGLGRRKEKTSDKIQVPSINDEPPQSVFTKIWKKLNQDLGKGKGEKEG